MFSFIPLKTTQKSNIASPITSYAKKCLSPTGYTNLKSIMPIVEEKRKEVIAIKKYLNSTSINTYLLYYGFVRQIVKSLPVLDKDPIGISVTWYDIQNSKASTTYNYCYEELCLLANIAALHTQAGFEFSKNKTDMNTVQSCVDEYEEATNIYNHIHTKLFQNITQVSKTWDMTENGLIALENYAHGMAQLALATKATLLNTKDIAKYTIYMGAKNLFEEAASNFNVCNSHEYYYRCKILAYLSQVYAYLCLHTYYLELTTTSNRGAGICYGLANEIKALMKDIGSKFEKRYLSSFAEIISDLTAKGNAAFSAALNANRIFLEAEVRVCDIPNLPAGKVLHPVKTPVLPAHEDEAFSNLVPQGVMQSLERYHQFVEVQLNEFLQKVEVANEEVAKAKEGLKVEDALNAGLTKPQTLSDDLWAEIHELQTNDVIANADKRYAVFMQIVNNCDTLLQTISQDVNQYTYQNPYGPRPIDPNQLIASVNKVAENVNQGKPGKDAVDATMQTVHQFASLLSSPREAIASQVPAVQMSTLCLNSLEEVRAVNEELTAMMEKRASEVNDILVMARNDVPVQDSLIANPNIDEKGIFNRCFIPVQNRMREVIASMNSQESLLRTLQTKCAAYKQHCEADSSAKLLEEFYHSLGQAIKEAQAAEGRIAAGIKYFSAVESIMKSIRAQLDQCMSQPQAYQGQPYAANGSKVCSRCNVLNNPQSTFCCRCSSPL